mmetsp:Transcript_18200/g.28242  ORF Transcript_18200/g.28242 Transcript_18200/m.28242 type:complete len:334 (-) Transcript_18200:999-2000(-)
MDTAIADVGQWIPRLDGVLVGPGLGRDRQIIEACSQLIVKAASEGMPVLLDADGLFIVTSALRAPGLRVCIAQIDREAAKTELIDLSHAEHDVTESQQQLLNSLQAAFVTLTPNKVEFERLCKAMGLAKEGDDPFSNAELLAPSVASRIGRNAVVIVKGARDIITDGTSTVVCDTAGSPRRCGGQGDVLAGLLLAFKVWAHEALAESYGSETIEARITKIQENPLMSKIRLACAFAACEVSKECARRAFQKKKRAMLASDVLQELGLSFNAIFPLEEEEQASWEDDWILETDLTMYCAATVPTCLKQPRPAFFLPASLSDLNLLRRGYIISLS